MVPKGWERTTFDNHIDCLTGFAFSSDGYCDEKKGTRLLRGDNIEPGKLRWENAKFWPEIYSEKLNRYFLLEGDFVIALDRTWVSSGLKVAEVTRSDLPCLLVQRVMRIRSKKTLEQNLLRQYFSGYLFEQYVKKNQTATAVPHISPNDVKEFALLLPPLPEQKKIAQILSAWDSAISVTEKLLTNSQQQKKALMQQLLTGKKRLCDESGVRFSGEWKKSNLGDIANIDSGYAFKSKDFTALSSGMPIIRMSDFKNGGLDISNAARVDTSCIEGLERFQLKVGDFVFGMSGSLNNYGEVRKEDLPCYLNQRVGRLTAKKNTNQKFITYMYLSEFIQKEIIDNAAGAAQLNISVSDLRNIQVSFPDVKEQQKIASVLSSADDEISTLEKKLACLKDEKKALMQQLLTGKRRVVIDADAV